MKIEDFYPINEEPEDQPTTELYSEGDEQKQTVIAWPIAKKKETTSIQDKDKEFTEQTKENQILERFMIKLLRLATAKITLRIFALENQPNSFKRWNVFKLSVIEKCNFDSRLLKLSNFRLFQLKWLNDYQSINIEEKHHYPVKIRD